MRSIWFYSNLITTLPRGSREFLKKIKGNYKDNRAIGYPSLLQIKILKKTLKMPINISEDLFGF